MSKILNVKKCIARGKCNAITSVINITEEHNNNNNKKSSLPVVFCIKRCSELFNNYVKHRKWVGLSVFRDDAENKGGEWYLMKDCNVTVKKKS